MRGWISILSAAGLAITVCACGGSSHDKTTSTAATHATGATRRRIAPLARVLTEEVRQAATTNNFEPALKVKAGEGVILRTTFPPARQAVPIKLTFHTGPAGSVSVTARSRGHAATARLTGPGKGKISLLDIRYNCSLPPLPSACPPEKVHRSSGATSVTFPTHISLLIAAKIGPTTVPAHKLPRVVSTVVPPYLVTEDAVSVTPSATGGKGSATPVASSVTTKPGDIIVFSTHLRARTIGVPQRVTITINQGPGKTIAITAAVPGEKPAIATVKSATDANIALVTPHYGCLLPPAPTFCPATKTVAGSRRYTVSFAASPATPPIVILAKVQAA